MTTPLTIVSIFPAQDARGIPLNGKLVVTFSEPIKRGAGYLDLRDLQGNVVQTEDIASSASIVISGATLTFTPAAHFVPGHHYGISLPVGAVLSAAGSPNPSFQQLFHAALLAGPLTLDGSAGADFLHGSELNDVLGGASGDDQLYGYGGDDTLNGGEGHDYLLGGTGINKLHGGAGNDYIEATASDSIDGGAGEDRIFIDLRTSAGAQAGVSGGEGKDTIFLQHYGSAPLAISGGAGDDIVVLVPLISPMPAVQAYVTDFGATDRIDLTYLQGYEGLTDNPFNTRPGGALVRLLQDGADTLLQALQPDSTPATYVTLLRIEKILPAQLGAANFFGGVNPLGGNLGETRSGTAEHDQMTGSFLDDTFDGLGGDDLMWGGSGADTLRGGAGDDKLEGQGGNDILEGGSGNDALTDSAGLNRFFGGDGDDVLIDTSAIGSNMDGGAGNDTLSGGFGIDLLDGGAGNDKILIGAGTPGLANTVSVIGGAGDDTITATLAEGSLAIVRVTGGAGADQLVFGSAFGGAGMIVEGFNSAEGDRLDLRGALPADTGGNPFGTSGFLRATQQGADIVIALDRDGAAGATHAFTTLFKLENMTLANLTRTGFTDQYDPSGSSSGVTLTGTAGKDSLSGTAQEDKLYGMGEGDILYGGGGADLLEGGDESGTEIIDYAGFPLEVPRGDHLYGGFGDDTLRGNAGGDTLYGDGGNDLLEGGVGADMLTGGDGNDTLDGGEGNDQLDDGAGSNTLRGGDGSDTLRHYGAGSSVLDGGSGDDRLYSRGGSASLIGGEGSDRFEVAGNEDGPPNQASIDGGQGHDTIILESGAVPLTVRAAGGTFADTYRFINQPFQGQLIISDFSPGTGGDLIDALPMVLQGIHSSGNPFGASGYLRLAQQGADTVLQYDPNGAAGGASFSTLVTFTGVASDKFTRDNFAQGTSPDGSATGMTIGGSALNDTLSGGLLDDTIGGHEGADTIYAAEGSDRLYGEDDADFLHGMSGNDTLDGGAGDDKLYGGDGKDTAVYSLARAAYTIKRDGWEANVTANSGSEGSDTVNEIERLQFSDTAYALDINGNAGQVYRLYRAAFDRAPDKVGLGFWISVTDKGADLGFVTDYFVRSDEFKTLYGAAPSNAELVTRYYNNVLDRAPDATGFDYWTGMLDNKVLSPANVLQFFSESPENVDAVAKLIGNGFEYTPYG